MHRVNLVNGICSFKACVKAVIQTNGNGEIVKDLSCLLNGTHLETKFLFSRPTTYLF